MANPSIVALCHLRRMTRRWVWEKTTRAPRREETTSRISERSRPHLGTYCMLSVHSIYCKYYMDMAGYYPLSIRLHCAVMNVYITA